PQRGEIMVFGSPCMVYRNPEKKTFVERGQHGMIVGVGEETKGYRVYLTKGKVAVATQHVLDIETLDKEQNENGMCRHFTWVRTAPRRKRTTHEDVI
ncbi:Copia-like retrotransposable element, partial [Phytophthora megakarya]